jgi:hypothetical protein
MLLKIMENVRRVTVLELKTAKVIFSRVAALVSETAELISARLVVLESKTAEVILSTVAVVKFRITSLVFAKMFAAEMGPESAIAHALRSLEQMTPTW